MLVSSPGNRDEVAGSPCQPVVCLLDRRRRTDHERCRSRRAQIGGNTGGDRRVAPRRGDDCPRANHGRAARGAPGAGAACQVAVQTGGGVDFRQPDAVCPERGLRPLSARRSRRSGQAQEGRVRPRVVARAQRHVSGRLRHADRARWRRGGAGERFPPALLRRRGHRLLQAVHAGRRPTSRYSARRTTSNSPS